MNHSAIQYAEFLNDGFVLHKIPSSYESGCRYSAWYDQEGALTAADSIDRRGRCRNVPEGGEVWAYLQQVGKPYVKKKK